MNFYYTLFFIIFFTNAIGTSKEDLCKKFKYFNLSDDSLKYDEFINELVQSNLTTCDCIKFLLEKRIKKRLANIYSETEIKELQSKIKSASQKEKELILTFDKDISSELQKRVKRKIDEEQIKGIIHVQLDSSSSIKLYEKGLILDGKRALFQNKYTLSLEKEIFQDSSQQSVQGGIIKHELEHIKRNHLAQKLYKFANEAFSYIWPVGVVIALFKKICMRDKYLKLTRAQEAEADRLPAACGSYQDCIDQYNQHAFHYFKYKDKIDVYSNSSDPEHPPYYKRLYWATVIKNAREAEKRLEEKEKSRHEALLKFCNNFE